jgi:hypothetical protein
MNIVGVGNQAQLLAKVRSWLTMMTKMHRKNRRPDGDRYACTEEVVLFNGATSKANFAEMGAIPCMPFGKCFENAWEVSQADRRWTYAEGWGLMDHSIPTHHAWLVGPDGRIEDPTWRSVYWRHRDATPNEEFTGHVVYWGVTIPHDRHLHWAAHVGFPNLLSVGDWDIPEVRRFGIDAFGMDFAGDCRLCGEPEHTPGCPKRRWESIVSQEFAAA